MSGTLNKFIIAIQELVWKPIKIDTGARATIQITLIPVILENPYLIVHPFSSMTELPKAPTVGAPLCRGWTYASSCFVLNKTGTL
jgi:hypothetical protein